MLPHCGHHLGNKLLLTHPLLACPSVILFLISTPLHFPHVNITGFLAKGFDPLPSLSSCLQADVPSMSLLRPWQLPWCPPAFHPLAAPLFSWHSSPK